MRRLKIGDDTIRFIDVIADTDEVAYIIFEVLNAREQALIDFDLLRKFLLKNASPNRKDLISDQVLMIEALL